MYKPKSFVLFGLAAAFLTGAPVFAQADGKAPAKSDAKAPAKAIDKTSVKAEAPAKAPVKAPAAKPDAKAAAKPAAKAPAKSAMKAGATLKGDTFLKFAKTYPKPHNIYKEIKTEPKCAQKWSKPAVPTEQVRTTKMDPPNEHERLLRNVIVYVSGGLDKKEFKPPAEFVELDQDGCIYRPHVLTLQVGQTLRILNNDPVLHNINAQPAKNPPFNVGQPRKGMKKDISFKKPEIFKVKCDVHKWMNGWVGVFDHPFRAVSNEKGAFEIKDLPPGNYEITAWHEVFGKLTKKVTVKPGDNELDFTFEVPASSGS